MGSHAAHGNQKPPPTPFNLKERFLHPKLDSISYLTNKKRGLKAPFFFTAM
jgi:hypothetical protein